MLPRPAAERQLHDSPDTEFSSNLRCAERASAPRARAVRRIARDREPWASGCAQERHLSSRRWCRTIRVAGQIVAVTIAKIVTPTLGVTLGR